MPPLLFKDVRQPLPFLLLLFCLITAGCTTEDRPRRGPGGQQPMATLAGRESFFSGRITAEVQIGAMTGFVRTGASSKDGADEPARPGRRRSGGMGGGMGGGPGGHEREQDDTERPRPSRPRMQGDGSPPVAIHLRLTNESTGPVEVEITDFNSALGNFAVQPSHLILTPSQSLEVEPMGSRLANDATSGEISLSLRLDGVKETKILNVQAKPAPPAAPATN